jgi:isoleucyl-tRNA synthetase
VLDRYLGEGRIDLTVQGEAVELVAGDIEIVSSAIGDWRVASHDGVTVALDTALTPELVARGHARDVIRAIQGMRKSLDLDLTERIGVQFRAGDALAAPIVTHRALILRETLGLALQRTETPEGEQIQDFDIDGAPLTLAIRRVR